MVSLGGGFLGGITGGTTVAVTIRAVDKFSKIFTKATFSIKSLAKVAAVGALAGGVALAALGVSAIKTAASFETAFTGVRKTVDLTEKEFEDLENRFKDITKITPLTFQEISKIGEIAGQLGVEGVDNLEKFTKTIADISVTTNLTAEAAATDFARIANVMQLSLVDVDRMGATVVDLGNNFATTEAEISQFAQRMSGAAAIAGFSVDEVFALSAALSSVGVQAEAGGSAMQRALLMMNEAVVSGNEDLSVLASTAGITSKEFQELWEKDASKAFEQFVLGLGQQGDAAFATLDEIGLGGIRTARSFLSLANAGDLVTETFETANTAWKENTALTEEAEKRYKTFDSQMAILGNTIKLLIEPLGEELIPIILDLAKIFTDEVMPAIQPLIPVIGEFLTKAIKAFVDLVVPLLPDLIDLAAEFLEIAIIILDILVPALKAITPVLKVIIQGVKQAITWIKQLIDLLSDSFIGDIIRGIGSFAKIGGKVITGDIAGANVEADKFMDAFKQPGRFDTTTVGDAIIKPSGEIIRTDPKDTLIATKTPGAMGGITIYIESVNGLDPDAVAEALQDKLKNIL